eukprot:CAMPEP_0119183838 /NCGR_PEP_ID=MMETSP1315-20130426/65103_1 /TAXON_ID=676789 /ORGANISM="Prasinoderma singularis, Strain RCC927" /LENGTH=33 /DNA_ID= /DNA_START= /DNA_END= /DNA_ORIENTATION=
MRHRAVTLLLLLSSTGSPSSSHRRVSRTTNRST